MKNKFRKISRDIDVLKLIQNHPFMSVVSVVFSLVNFYVSWKSTFEKDKTDNLIIVLFLATSIFIIFISIKGIQLWNRYYIYRRFSNSVGRFLKDTSLTDIEYLSKLDKEDERFLQSPVVELLNKLNPQQIYAEQKLFNKKYSSWTKEYLKSIFDELDTFLENTYDSEVEMTLQLLTEKYNPSQINDYYDAFVDKNRKSVKNHTPVALNDSMLALIHFKENKKRYIIRNNDTVIFLLSTVNINNQIPTIYGFMSLKFSENIEEDSINFSLIIDCVIAKVEELCYYMKVLESSYGLFPSALFEYGGELEEFETTEQFFNTAIEISDDLDFLKIIYSDFSSGGDIDA